MTILFFSLLANHLCIASSEKYITTNTYDKIKIATLNLKNIEHHISENPDLLNKLAKFIFQFDLVALQGNLNNSGNTYANIEHELDKFGIEYSIVVSDSSDVEQYAYVYRVDRISMIDHFISDLQNAELIQAKPLIAQFSAIDGTFDFVLINVHSESENAISVLDFIDRAVIESQQYFSDEGDFIVIGSLKLGCNFNYNNSDYTFLIANDFSENTRTYDCPPDFISFGIETKEDYANETDVYNSDQIFEVTIEENKEINESKMVSSVFFINQDTDNELNNSLAPFSAVNCQGCCSYHGGVVCVGGVTKCADGEPLSDTCREKGCNACSTDSDNSGGSSGSNGSSGGGEGGGGGCYIKTVLD